MGMHAVCPQLEEGDTIYEFLVAPSSGTWQHWREKVPLWRYPAAEERPKFAQLVIPTLDSVRYEHLMSLVHSVGKVRFRPPHRSLNHENLQAYRSWACFCCLGLTGRR